MIVNKGVDTQFENDTSRDIKHTCTQAVNGIVNSIVIFLADDSSDDFDQDHQEEDRYGVNDWVHSLAA